MYLKQQQSTVAERSLPIMPNLDSSQTLARKLAFPNRLKVARGEATVKKHTQPRAQARKMQCVISARVQVIMERGQGSKEEEL